MTIIINLIIFVTGILIGYWFKARAENKLRDQADKRLKAIERATKG